MVNGSVDLGAGNDTLTLANFTNRVSVANTETILGGSGNDTIILTGNIAATVIGGAGLNFITGNTGADQFVFDQNSYGNYSILTNFSATNGDKIALDTTGSGILSGNTYDLGGAALTAGKDLADVANVAARLATTLANGGKGGFVYEQDTGELFYSGNGSFAGGGTHDRPGHHGRFHPLDLQRQQLRPGVSGCRCGCRAGKRSASRRCCRASGCASLSRPTHNLPNRDVQPAMRRNRRPVPGPQQHRRHCRLNDRRPRNHLATAANASNSNTGTLVQPRSQMRRSPRGAASSRTARTGSSGTPGSTPITDARAFTSTASCSRSA